MVLKNKMIYFWRSEAQGREMIKYIKMNQHIVYNITRPVNILGLSNDKLIYYSGC